MQMKTYQDWNTASTLTSYLNPEDEIDQEMVNYFCEKLPAGRRQQARLRTASEEDWAL